MCAFLFSLYIFIPRQSGGPRTFFFTYQMREYLNATRRVQYDKWNEKSGLSRLGHFLCRTASTWFQMTDESRMSYSWTSRWDGFLIVWISQLTVSSREVIFYRKQEDQEFTRFYLRKLLM